MFKLGVDDGLLKDLLDLNVFFFSTENDFFPLVLKLLESIFFLKFFNKLSLDIL